MDNVKVLEKINNQKDKFYSEVGKVIVTSGCPLVVLNALVMAVPD